MWAREGKLCLWELLRVVHEQWKRLHATEADEVLSGPTPCVKHECDAQVAGVHELHNRYLDIDLSVQHFKKIGVKLLKASPGVDVATL